MSQPIETFTSTEVAQSFRKSLDWLYDQVSAGLVTPARASDAVNAQMIWTRADVDRLLKALTPAPMPKATKRKLPKALRT